MAIAPRSGCARYYPQSAYSTRDDKTPSTDVRCVWRDYSPATDPEPCGSGRDPPSRRYFVVGTAFAAILARSQNFALSTHVWRLLRKWCRYKEMRSLQYHLGPVAGRTDVFANNPFFPGPFLVISATDPWIPRHQAGYDTPPSLTIALSSAVVTACTRGVSSSGSSGRSSKSRQSVSRSSSTWMIRSLCGRRSQCRWYLMRGRSPEPSCSSDSVNTVAPYSRLACRKRTSRRWSVDVHTELKRDPRGRGNAQFAPLTKLPCSRSR